METIHVQLADEGRIVVVLEEFRDESLRKFVFVQNNEGVAVCGPTNEFCILAIFEEATKVSKGKMRLWLCSLPVELLDKGWDRLSLALRFFHYRGSSLEFFEIITPSTVNCLLCGVCITSVAAIKPHVICVVLLSCASRDLTYGSPSQLIRGPCITRRH